MHRPVCVSCEVEFNCEKNDTGVLDMTGLRESAEPYKLWHADKYKCPSCGVEIVVGFSQKAIDYFEGSFQRYVGTHEQRGTLVKNYERP